MYEATVSNGDCVTVDTACICYDWTLACVGLGVDITSDKAIAPDRPEDGDWEDIELFLNMYKNPVNCTGFKTVIPAKVKYRECNVDNWHFFY